MTSDQPRLVVRSAGRIALLDPADRVLLSNDAWGGNAWWCTPGGGVEAGEDAAQAALREVHEETGFDDIELGPVLVAHHWRDLFLDVVIDQTESIFLGRTAGGVAVPTKLDPLEATFMLGFRWWTVAELLATDETVYPEGLGWMLDRALREGPPAEPWTVETLLR